jgi:hypothetical protein
MRAVTDKARLVLIFGLAGIAGTILTIISDLILIGRPVSGYNYFRLGTELMAGIPQWRITIGAFLGILVLPLQILGLASLYYGMLRAGKIVTYCTFFLMAHALIMGVAFHTSYAFMGTGWKLHNELGLSNTASSGMISTFLGYWKTLIIVMFAETMLSSGIFAFCVAKGYTLYPLWMSILNPFCIFLFMFLLVLAIPAPVGGFAGSVYLNMSSLLFLILSMVIVYRRVN